MIGCCCDRYSVASALFGLGIPDAARLYVPGVGTDAIEKQY